MCTAVYSDCSPRPRATKDMQLPRASSKDNSSVLAPSVLGNAYCGQVDLQTGQSNGYGRWTCSDSVVEGMWREGKIHGRAKQTWSDGRVYEGDFRDGLFCGFGRMTWRHTRGLMVYEGEYADDMKHGEGKFIWPSGRMYEGQWVQGRREGIGVETSSAGTQTRGVWQDNVFMRRLSDAAETPSKD